MQKKTLHITNGSVVTKKLKTLDFKGDFLTWHEMLCEGPTIENIDSDEFISTREVFLKSFYNIEYNHKDFKKEIGKLNNKTNYKDVVLWFEFDMFCHINLIAVISLLLRKEYNIPIYLVCSGKIEREKGLKGLGELKDSELIHEYETKVLLEDSDLLLAQKCWKIYNSNNHNQFKPIIKTSSNFEYLTNCLSAHLRRFPDKRSGLSTIEFNILKLVRENTITSLHHLLGYALHYQGFYGYGDIQLERIINKLVPYLSVTEGSVTINSDGKLVLAHEKNVHNMVNDDMIFGSVAKYDYVFDKSEKNLIKKL